MYILHRTDSIFPLSQPYEWNNDNYYNQPMSYSSAEQEYGTSSNRIQWVQHGIGHAAAASFFASLSAPEFYLFNVKALLEEKEAVWALVDVGATVKATGMKITEGGQVYIWHFNE